MSKNDYTLKIIDQTRAILLYLYTPFINSSNLISLHTFIRDIIKKSNTTFSTLQIALLYIVKLSRKTHTEPLLFCGRRTFITALIISSKIKLEPAPKNSDWSSITGLPLDELNKSERLFLAAIDFKTFVSENDFFDWNKILDLTTCDLISSVRNKIL